MAVRAEFYQILTLQTLDLQITIFCPLSRIWKRQQSLNEALVLAGDCDCGEKLIYLFLFSGRYQDIPFSKSLNKSGCFNFCYQ